MMTPRRETASDATVVRSPELILRDVHQIAAVTSAARAVGNPLITPQSLEDALLEVATPSPKAQKQR